MRRLAARCGRRRPATATRSASTASTARRTARPAAGASRSAGTACTSGPKAIGTSSARSTTAASAPTARRPDRYCIDACPQEALSLSDNPVFETMGDYRWTPDLLASTWADGRDRPAARDRTWRARSGPRAAASTACGSASRTRLPPACGAKTSRPNCCSIAATIPGPKITIDVPWYGGGMSFGSTNIRALLGKARAAKAFNRFTCTGEGGYPDRFIPYDDHVITQVATGLFGVREETIQRARIVEFKYAQGAKPGLGGHLLGDKNTPERRGHARDGRGRLAVLARSRSTASTRWKTTRSTSTGSRTSTRGRCSRPRFRRPPTWTWWPSASTTPAAHIVHLDGSYGGTGAAPEHRQEEHRHADRVRHQPRAPVPGGRGHPRPDHGDRQRRHPHARTTSPRPSPWAPTACVIGTAELVALGCIRCGACESGRGCARGIATTDPELLEMVTVEWCTQRLVNLYTAWRRDAGGHPVPPGTRLRGRPARPHRPADPPGL